MVNLDKESECLNSRFAILVVDDQVEQASLICSALSRSGFEAYSAGSCSEAVDHINSHKVDLAILDLFLDDGQIGGDLLVKLREIDANLLVLFTSGINEGREFDIALSYPRTAFIKKPYRIATLINAVKQAIQRFS